MYNVFMDIFSALADPTRRKIIEMLASRGQLSATDIYHKFPVSHPAISQHLKVLREANLVQVEKRAQQRLYQINPRTMYELEDWVGKITKLWNERFDALDKLLEEEKKKLEGKS
jgi:DNA-binding transcriptional ArsR family regulator